MTYNKLSKVNTSSERTNYLIAKLSKAAKGHGNDEVAPGFIQCLSRIMDEDAAEFVGTPFTLAYQTYCEIR